MFTKNFIRTIIHDRSQSRNKNYEHVKLSSEDSITELSVASHANQSRMSNSNANTHSKVVKVRGLENYTHHNIKHVKEDQRDQQVKLKRHGSNVGAKQSAGTGRWSPTSKLRRNFSNTSYDLPEIREKVSTPAPVPELPRKAIKVGGVGEAAARPQVLDRKPMVKCFIFAINIFQNVK